MKSADDSQMALGLVCREGEVLEPTDCTMIDDPTLAVNRQIHEQFAEEKARAPDLATQEGDPDGMARSVDRSPRYVKLERSEPSGRAEPHEPEEGELPLIEENDDEDESAGSGYSFRSGETYPIFRAGRIKLAPDLRRRKADGLIFAKDLAEEGLALLRALPAAHTVPDRMPARAKVCCAQRAVDVVYAAHFRCRAQTLAMYEKAIEELDAGNIVGATAYVQVCLHLVLNRLATLAKSEAKKTAKKRTGRSKRTCRKTKSTRVRKTRTSAA